MAEFYLPKGVNPKDFQITESMSDVKDWKAKIFVNNSGNENQVVGQWDEVGYIMIGLDDNTIVPIARADEHRRGYELLIDYYHLDYHNYYPIFYKGKEFPYNEDDLNKLVVALKKAVSYGLNIYDKQIYMKNINKSLDTISAKDFLENNGKLFDDNNILPLGQDLIQAFKYLSEVFNKTTIRGKYSITLLNKAIKNLYNVCKKIKIEKNMPLMIPTYYEMMENDIIKYKEEYISNNDLMKHFFGFGGFRNMIHNILRKNQYNTNLIKQIGSVKDVIMAIGSI